MDDGTHDTGVQQHREEYGRLFGVDISENVDERLTVVIANRGDNPAEWVPVSIHETAAEAKFVAKKIREEAYNHVAETKTLPLYRHSPGEHTGTTNIGPVGGDDE